MVQPIMVPQDARTGQRTRGALLAVVAATVLLLATAPLARTLENGAARTPPLGWLSWQRYRCTIACANATAPDCFNEGLIRRVIDEMVAGGFQAAGYSYVALDDCWQAPARVNGHVVADPQRFPSGIKALAAYAHGKGLKLGMYTAMGNGTCASHHYATDPLGLQCDFDTIPDCAVAKRDITDFVSWDIDHLKVDGCFEFDRVFQNESYAIVSDYLLDAVAERGTTPVVYHPSNLGFRYPRQFRELAAIGNQWRWFNDVQDSWDSVTGIIAEIGAGQPVCVDEPLPANCTSYDGGSSRNTYCASFCTERDSFLSVPGPGGWHDPDMLLAGQTPCSAKAQADGMHCEQLTPDEERTQLAIWAMASAPLFMSNDLWDIPEASRTILLNPDLLAIDQDALGRMCFRFSSDAPTQRQMWRKDLAGGAVAVALVNLGEAAQHFSFRFDEVGFAPDSHVNVYDVWRREATGVQVGAYATATPVPAHGTTLLRLSWAHGLSSRHAEL